MAKVLIKNGPPELDVVYAYFRQHADSGLGVQVEMTFQEEGSSVSKVCYVQVNIMIPWTSSTKTWKFRGYVRTKNQSLGHDCRYFIGTYSFQTGAGEGEFVERFGQLAHIQL